MSLKCVIANFIIICIYTSCQRNEKPNQSTGHDNPTSDSLVSEKDPYGDFNLSYSSVGLGSNIGSMQSVFRVQGESYSYTLEQNSGWDSHPKEPEFVCDGLIRESSIDSILKIAKNIKDTLVFKMNSGIMSGRINYVVIKDNSLNITFELHNIWDSTAQKIVDILNSNIPIRADPLTLFSPYGFVFDKKNNRPIEDVLIGDKPNPNPTNIHSEFTYTDQFGRYDNYWIGNGITKFPELVLYFEKAGYKSFRKEFNFYPENDTVFLEKELYY